jgi:hypothetical protein
MASYIRIESKLFSFSVMECVSSLNLVQRLLSCSSSSEHSDRSRIDPSAHPEAVSASSLNPFHFGIRQNVSIPLSSSFSLTPSPLGTELYDDLPLLSLQ